MEPDQGVVGAIRATALFADLDEHRLAELAALLRPFRAAPGETLFVSGAPAERLFVLRAGEVELAAPVGDRAGAGDVLGELGLSESTTCTATATAVGPVEGLYLELDDFDQLRRDGDPLATAVLRRLARLLAERIRRTDATSVPAHGDQPQRTHRPGPDPREAFEEVAGLACFEQLAADQLREVLSALRSWSLDAGEALFTEGERARAAYVVLRGTVEVSRERSDRHVRLATLGPGRLLGELSLMDGGPRTATCVALEPTVMLELSAETLGRLLDDGSSAALGLLEAINHALIGALRATYMRRAAAHRAAGEPARAAARERLIERIRRSVIGDDAVFEGPFGPRRNVYADFTASGRALSFIEDFIRREVLPLYANTHTEASAMGLQTTRLREDARRIIHAAVSGTEDDAVVFCGAGATGAIDKLAQVLGLKLPSALDDRFGIRAAIPAEHRPVVFIGPYEHHSNELPWRESVADVVTILEDADGRIDLDHLEDELQAHADRPLKVGSFSAASNVTGITTDTEQVAMLLHRYGALSCWDYAAAGPYLPIDMNPSPDLPGGHLAYKDAVFISPHKFIGGPGTPGILVAKRALFANRVPSVPGGGTVLFVTADGQNYHPEPAVREEAGTPAIVESIRAGLVFALKEAVGTDEIHRREHGFVARALDSWGANPRIKILGNPRLDRLAIVSFGLRHGDGLLHAHFAAALLNDLFGIQSRSGCFCAGPYVQRMHGIEQVWGERMEAEIALGHEGAKLAFLRVNFNYFLSEAAFQYIVDAVHFVADEGWKLLPLYRFDPYSGLWHHQSGRTRPALTLHDVSFETGTLEFHGERATVPESALAGYLAQARRIVGELEAAPPPDTMHQPPLSADFERVRWFPLPGEALAELRAGTSCP